MWRDVYNIHCLWSICTVCCQYDQPGEAWVPKIQEHKQGKRSRVQRSKGIAKNTNTSTCGKSVLVTPMYSVSIVGNKKTHRRRPTTVSTGGSDFDEAASDSKTFRSKRTISSSSTDSVMNMRSNSDCTTITPPSTPPPPSGESSSSECQPQQNEDPPLIPYDIGSVIMVLYGKTVYPGKVFLCCNIETILVLQYWSCK